MTLLFLILGVLTLAGAVAALTLRNLVHCVLALTLAFVGLAGLYLQLGAQFMGFAQILVYVGAVAILIVFAILLTRGATSTFAIDRFALLAQAAPSPPLFLVCLPGRFAQHGHSTSIPPQPEVTVKQIGNALMSQICIAA